MDFLQGKTPISFLQELCTKRGITPQYDLIANEGAVHEPTFVFKVSAGDEFMGTGKGPSKKKAKHNAALSMLKQMMGVEGQELVDPAGESNNALDPENEAGNPVGELQEMTQKRMWPPPTYDYSNEIGPAHSREFVCHVTLHNLKERGIGRSKKIAKRNAALAMIQLLRKGGAEPVVKPENVKEEFDPDNIPLPNSELVQTYNALKEGKITTLTPQASRQIGEFYQQVKNNPGNGLQNLQKEALNSLQSECYIQMLQDISKEQKFEVTYVDIPEQTTTDTVFSLVEMAFKKPKNTVVCQGMGDNKELSQENAAANALLYLATVKKK